MSDPDHRMPALALLAFYAGLICGVAMAVRL